MPEKKKYTESEFKAGIKKAALKSATAAVEGVRAKDDLIDAEKNEAIKELDKNTKAKGEKKSVNPTKSMKAAIKRSVLKSKADKADALPSTKPSNHAELMAAIKGISAAPAASGLNAAASAGVDIAHQILDKTAGVSADGIISEIVRKKGVKGITASGMLDEDDDDDALLAIKSEHHKQHKS